MSPSRDRRDVPVHPPNAGPGWECVATAKYRARNDPFSIDAHACNTSHAVHLLTPPHPRTQHGCYTIHRALNATLRAALEYDQTHADRRSTRPEFVIFGGIFAALVAVACVACHHHGPEHEREGAGGGGS